MIHREEEQCRQCRHTSPGVGKHEGKGAVLNGSTHCPRSQGVVTEGVNNPLQEERRGVTGDTKQTHKYSHFTIAYKWILIHSTYYILYILLTLSYVSLQ